MPRSGRATRTPTRPPRPARRSRRGAAPRAAKLGRLLRRPPCKRWWCRRRRHRRAAGCRHTASTAAGVDTAPPDHRADRSWSGRHRDLAGGQHPAAHRSRVDGEGPWRRSPPLRRWRRRRGRAPRFRRLDEFAGRRFADREVGAGRLETKVDGFDLEATCPSRHPPGGARRLEDDQLVGAEPERSPTGNARRESGRHTVADHILGVGTVVQAQRNPQIGVGANVVGDDAGRPLCRQQQVDAEVRPRWATATSAPRNSGSSLASDANSSITTTNRGSGASAARR